MKKGFTLIELLVVVLIIGILASIAVPQYRFIVEKAKVTQMVPLFKSITAAQERYYQTKGVYTSDIDLLDIKLDYTLKTDDAPECVIDIRTPNLKCPATAAAFFGRTEHTQ